MPQRNADSETPQKAPNPIDIHVGGRVRLRRMLMGISQEKLAEHLGITFQQVQKYEKGTNRISASKLWEAAQVLGVPVSFFYGEMAETGQPSPAGLAEADGDTYVSDFIGSREGLQLMKAFMAIEDPRVRRRIIDLVESLAAKSG
ncbi:helix-turn-helix domain-containing protein [Lutibaculum baratangense]|uniref:Transcriptional regulator, XRE family n=1 Tax=Lutibaculum baratangense AMV1 TaxID=631454 RepID=V4RKR3_9HYPH|nr:helix-turn-helix domain-containing protein [Lutibaculum baratangense]ESR25874.1 transcriptional regulator, XRE family [Lutibaculum baratangense AMV1]